MSEGNGRKYRSARSGVLHHLICNTLFNGSTLEEASASLDRLDDFFSDYRNRDYPNFILEAPPGNRSETHGRTHFADVIYLSLSPKVENTGLSVEARELQSEKAITMFDSLTRFAQDAIERGKITRDQYAQTLTRYDNQGETLLSTAVQTGNLTLIKVAFDEVKDFVEPEKYRELLMATNATGWNLFHNITAPRPRTGSPDPFVVDFLIGEFHAAFGEQAVPAIRELCNAQTDALPRPSAPKLRPINPANPSWLKDMLRQFESVDAKPMSFAQRRHSQQTRQPASERG